MTPLFPAQRAAEEFDQVLGGTAPPAVTDRYADLLETVTALRTRPEVLPRAEFVDELRSRLITAAETELVPAPSNVRELRPARPAQTRRRLGTAVASLVIVGGTAGMAAAASGSLPGEGLYPIKRGVENAEAIARVGDAGKGKAQLDQAGTRLEEVRALQAQGSPDAELVTRTVDAFRSSAEAGSNRLFQAFAANGDTQDITTVRTFAADQMAAIAAIAGTSATTDAALVDAADTLADIDQRAVGLCASCGPAAPVALPPALAAGAGAATAESLLARPVAQARADIKRVADQQAADFAALKSAAEKSAGKIPQIDLDKLRTSTGTTGVAGPPVTSTITPDGRLVPSFSTGAAVKDVVSGLTQSLEGVTGAVTGGSTPLDKAVEGVTGAVDGATEDLTDGLDKLKPSAAPGN